MDEIFARYAPKPLPPTLTHSTKPTVTNIGKPSETGLPIQSYESVPFGSERSSEDFYSTGRKRSHHDANSYGQDTHYGNGTASKSSRSKRGPRDARVSGRLLSSQQRPSPAETSSYPFINVPPPPTPPPGFPAFDPTNPMAAYAFMQTMFPQIVGMLPPSPNGDLPTFGTKPRCQDYDTKGYCTLGSSCPYEHGNDIIVAPRDDEYDPTRANFSMNGTKRGTPRASSHTQRTRRAPGSLGHFDVKRNHRAAFSDTRFQPHDNFTTLVVEQIPEECFEDDAVRNFFSHYGKVLDVAMNPYKRLALVTYDSHAAARRAWESPRAVFENRFVKVYWYRPDLEGANTATGNSSRKDHNESMNADIAGEEDFKRQQEDKQKAYEERMRVKKAMEDARHDLVRRRENMLKEREALVSKLAIAEGHEAGQDNTNGTNGLHDSVGIDSPDPKIRALRDQLAKMQAEAKSLGIDPDAPADDLHYASGGRSTGFGTTVRGGIAARSAYRGYGSSSGRYPGHRFIRGRDPSVRKLDNRPRSIAISGLVFDDVKEENLRSYLTLIGPFEDIELNPQRTDSRIIVFKERWQGEQVMYGKNDIPGVGKVELSWVANTANGNQAQELSSYEDVVSGDAGENARRAFSDEAQQPQDDNLDVAGGDDDDWGNIT